MLILLSLLFSPLTVSAAPIRLACVTEWPTTSFVVREEGDTLSAQLIFHNGTEYAPVINGIYTPHDLPTLAEKAALAQKLSNQTTFHWPAKKCHGHDLHRFECFGTEDEQKGVGGEAIRPFALYTTKLSEDGIAGKYEYVSMALTFNVVGQGESAVEMRYDAQGCFDPDSKVPEKYLRSWLETKKLLK